MNKSKIYIIPILIAVGLFASYFNIKKNLKNNRRPVPTEFIEKKLRRKDFKEDRKEYIKQMHRSHPDTDWQALDHQTRQEKSEKVRQELEARLKNGKLNRSGLNRVSTANRNVSGEWNERGSNNLAGRIRTAEVDFENGLIYCASSGGNIWRGSIDGENWESMNDYMQVKGISFLRLIDAEGISRLVVGSNDAFYYSDSDGLILNPTAGLENVNTIKRYALLGTDIYALVKEWDSEDNRNETKLYQSTDFGVSFQHFVSFDSHNGFNPIEMPEHFDLWTDRYFGGDVYIVNDNSFYRVTANGIELISSFVSNSSGEVLLTGGMGMNSPFFYVLYGSDIYSSSNGGSTWVNRGESPSSWWFMVNSFGSSNINSDVVAIGGMEAFRSTNSGNSWEVINDWWAYYDNPVNDLHADIPEIQFFLDEEFNEFALISTDGGIYMMDADLNEANNLSLNGLGVSQYYSTYTKRTSPYHIYVGSQDQGFQRSNGDEGGILDFVQSVSGDYGHLVSGDGGETLWCNYPGFTMYYNNPQGGGGGMTLDFPGDGHMWLAPLIADPQQSNWAYLGGGSETSGNHIIKLTASSWGINYEQLDQSFSGTISAMAISPINYNYRYVLTESGKFYHSADAGDSWQMTNNFTGPSPQYFYGSTIEPSSVELGVVYIGGSGYSNPPVYRSSNHGISFQSMSAGLPNTLVYQLATSDGGELLFAATEVGPYVYDVYEEEWFDLAGLSAPDQTYWTVDYVPVLQTARFGTYGRGIWDFVLDDNYNIISGDLNDDDNVNIQDIVILVNVLIGGWELTETQMQAGDMNDDGFIDILDIVQVVNIILGR
jgi:hypothetical protein